MNKIVSASEFKAKCLRLIDEMQADGVPITITKRGKPVAEMKPKGDEVRRSVIGMLRSPEYDPDWDHEASTSDPGDWEALR
jgi:antitoxin (DNA-binding transcriptional repressor) of toxin-antitoxin stability system